MKIKSANLGYYHHRIIFWFELTVNDEKVKLGIGEKDLFHEIRKITAELKKKTEDLVRECVVERINELVKKRFDQAWWMG